MSDVTRILNAIEQGDAQASYELPPLVYEEPRVPAAQKLSQEKPGQTLQATALVREPYIRLAEGEDQSRNSRGHFFKTAAEAMRRILIDDARRAKILKRGGGRRRVELDNTVLADEKGTTADPDSASWFRLLRSVRHEIQYWISIQPCLASPVIILQ